MLWILLLGTRAAPINVRTLCTAHHSSWAFATRHVKVAKYHHAVVFAGRICDVHGMDAGEFTCADYVQNESDGRILYLCGQSLLQIWCWSILWTPPEGAVNGAGLCCGHSLTSEEL